MRVLASGDSIVTRRLSSLDNASVEELRDVVRTADIAFTNLETPIPTSPLVPGILSQGMHVFGPPFVVDELAWLGFGVVNIANNHAVDYTLQGLIDTMAVLREREMPFAGAGLTLGAARAPAYVETPGGRLGLIGTASSNATIALAADPRADMAGRPGINPLRFTTTYELCSDKFAQLRRIHDALGLSVTQQTRVAASRSRRGDIELGGTGPQSLTVANAVFAEGSETRVLTVPDRQDMCALERVIAEARAQADVVVVSVHAHEGIDDGWNSELPASFLRTACRSWIDAGADAVFGHGPHCLRGAEIYRDRPIFYSLGNFVFTLETVAHLPREAYEKQGLDPDTSLPFEFHDAAVLDDHGRPTGFLAQQRFWESILARVDVDDSGTDAEVIPVLLSRDVARSRRGIPALATGATGRRILKRFASLCAAFDTGIDIETRDGRFTGRLRSLKPN